MNRAIVYVAWGEPYIRKAEASAATASIVGADRFLITDTASHLTVAPDAPFEQVIEHEFRLPGYLRKTEIFDVLPDKYDSFVFLDADTHILLSIEQGFDRAERHGIAAAPAAHYSLENFWGFSEVLKKFNFRSYGILQYNSGVIFFTRDSAAWQVLKKWRELCNAAEGDFSTWTDQPYLTLAMELSNFNPYTLSIAYNYRNFGELASGYIRIWHSHLPPPPDVNVFSSEWPPRRFLNSVRLSSDV